jgi:hypothetical protein
VTINNNGESKSRAGKTAGKKSAGKKKAGGKPANSSEDVTESSAAKKRARAAKSAAVKSKPERKPGKRRATSGATQFAASTAGAAALDPMEVAKQTMKGSVPAIVKAMVKKAREGSCSHAKTLLEMTGAKYMFGGDTEMQHGGEPWAKLVLERMEQAEQESSHPAPMEVSTEP